MDLGLFLNTHIISQHPIIFTVSVKGSVFALIYSKYQWLSRALPAPYTYLVSYGNHCLSFAFLPVLAELQIPAEMDLELCLQVGKMMLSLFESARFYGRDLKFQDLDVHLSVTLSTGIFWQANVESILGHLEVAGVAGTSGWDGEVRTPSGCYHFKEMSQDALKINQHL